MQRPLPKQPSRADSRKEPRPVAQSTITSIAISQPLIAWQSHSGRHGLPWQVKDPYKVWLSEIMLQQTQVSAVIPYFEAFVKRFPSLEALANSPQESVLEAWSGLGYYSRARHLHRCARIIMTQHKGQFPNTVGDLKALPGIGPSTAAAICAFSFGGSEAILDGNVKRVMARLFSIAGPVQQLSVERELWEIARTQLPQSFIGTYTQGLMDLGATVCMPRSPSCPICPLKTQCQAFKLGLVANLPTPKPSKKTPIKEMSFGMLVHDSQVLMVKQASPGVWGGLWSFPQADHIETLAQQLGLFVTQVQELASFTHVFTHFKLQAKVRLYRSRSRANGPLIARDYASQDKLGTFNADPLRWLNAEKIASAALPKPIKSYLLEHALLL